MTFGQKWNASCSQCPWSITFREVTLGPLVTALTPSTLGGHLVLSTANLKGFLNYPLHPLPHQVKY